ncbi:MAG: phage holin family protein [Liquorilactobacillus nagelii]|jgi:toxin secretion/phage lysis holin|nr:phage holin family protein [Liquorilactobacillus nagelii]KRL41540.1 toxin secretion phage lysis holin [Liquorilactobacillus nagelii DSM 13675]MCI1922085.1 phage holin family protein [Liquorilactobacillus nagelii]MCI1977156.1 phage holin family protein [Liquorilactobacillus nagelii]QYH55475.1 phage holin family protein [Liquorilactobacillus nagelii DSM 13675]ULQ50518.1 phage holin family protein [Liquorilactobacillus nagelii]
MLFGWYIGKIDSLVYILLVFITLDYLTGLLCAISQQKLSSEIGFRGIFRKMLILILVGVAHLLDSVLLPAGASLRTAVIFFYLSNEGISLLENAGQLGIPIPNKLKAILSQLSEKNKNH